MSAEEAYQAMRAAITEWFAADNNGAVVEAFVIHAAGRTIEDALHDPEDGAITRGSWATAPGQQTYASLGLAHQLITAIQSDLREIDE